MNNILENVSRTITAICAICGLWLLLIGDLSFVVFVWSFVFGWVATHFAKKKGLNDEWAFINGFTWGLIGVLYYIVCKKKE